MGNTKFKVGDKVRVVGVTDFRSEYNGEVLTIRSINPNAPFNAEEHYGFKEDICYVFEARYLKLAEAPFTKADLKDGMILEFRDGFRYMLMGKRAYGKNGWSDFDRGHKDDLTSSIFNNDTDVMKVYLVKDDARGFLYDLFSDKNLVLLWEREEETKEMTVAEIEKKLGYKVKVIADKE